MSGLTCGEYGMKWRQAIDSQLGTGTRYMSGLTCGELDAHDESDTLAIEAWIRACCSRFELVTQVVFKSSKVSNIIYFAL